MMKRSIVPILVLLTLCVAFALPAEAKRKPFTFALADDAVRITTGFTGTELVVFGTLDERGTTLLLSSKELGSLKPGVRIYYRQIPVGYVSSYTLNANANGDGLLLAPISIYGSLLAALIVVLTFSTPTTHLNETRWNWLPTSLLHYLVRNAAGSILGYCSSRSFTAVTATRQFCST